MRYRFVTAAPDYAHLASGRVLYSVPGAPALPVRLTSEIFQRALAHYQEQGGHAPVTLYDPCCGGAYHLAVLGLLHGDKIGQILASDVEEEILPVARRNLSLLTHQGLAARRQELQEHYARYAKASHQAALVSLDRLATERSQAREIPSRTFVADATRAETLAGYVPPASVALALADVPYGKQAHWHGIPAPAHAGEEDGASPLFQLLAALRPLLQKNGVVAIISDKGQRARHPAYGQLERLRVGKRQITLLRPS